MSSSLQSALESLQWDNYTSLVVPTVVIYDYLLVFAREVHYVWHRPWTWVSTMFIVIRYIGLSWAILAALWGSAFLSGTTEMCLATILISAWGEAIFFAAADCIFDSSKTYFSVKTAQIGNFNTCAVTINNIPLIFTTHLADGIIQTIKQSIGVFKATKKWQPNKYMQQLVTDGILYFLVYLAFNITITIIQDNASNAAWNMMFKVSYIAVIPMIPRFIISMRELYGHNGYSQQKGIDSGFGVLSQPTASPNVVMSAIAFAGVTFRQGESQVHEDGADDPEVIQPEIVGDASGAHQLGKDCCSVAYIGREKGGMSESTHQGQRFSRLDNSYNRPSCHGGHIMAASAQIHASSEDGIRTTLMLTSVRTTRQAATVEGSVEIMPKMEYMYDNLRISSKVSRYRGLSDSAFPTQAEMAGPGARRGSGYAGHIKGDHGSQECLVQSG
ncbi:hypothetical protein V8E55_009670 [Tylopilus felleus]